MENEIRKERAIKVLLVTLAIAIGLLLIVFGGQMMHVSVLPVSYVAAIVLTILIFFGLGIFLVTRKKLLIKVIGAFLIIASFAVNIEGINIYVNSMKALDTIANQNSETTNYGIYVLTTSDINSIEDLNGKKVGISKDISFGKITGKMGQNGFRKCSYDSPLLSVEGLLNKECEGVILNVSYMEMLEEDESNEDLSGIFRLIDQIDVTQQVEAPNVITPEDPFIVYISGKDTWGHISVTSRSDVNILAVVNPGTKHILLVSTPRDYYVPLSISNGIKDKLTHSGIYGMNVSEDTMEMLYDLKIDHYFKLNYSGFEGLIDAMGGITVWSDYAFDVENIGHFNKGENELTGLQALAFVRERHAFARGDVQRGENQMNVIQSVVQKLSSKSTLINYSAILKECDGTFATDISTEEIADLVSYQLDNPGDWNIEKLSVGGTGELNHVYSLKKKVYVMNPNEDDLDNAKKRIKEVLDEH